MKALEILKHKWISGNVVFDEKYNKHIRYIKYSEELINKAIKELEELQSRSCENCKYLDMDLICTNEDTPCCSEYSGRFDDFNCNKWEISK